MEATWENGYNLGPKYLVVAHLRCNMNEREPTWGYSYGKWIFMSSVRSYNRRHRESESSICLYLLPWPLTLCPRVLWRTSLDEYRWLGPICDYTRIDYATTRYFGPRLYPFFHVASIFHVATKTQKTSPSFQHLAYQSLNLVSPMHMLNKCAKGMP